MKTLSESNQRERDWREKQKFSLSNIIEEKMYKKYWENTFALQWERRGIIIITYLSLKMHYYCTNICGFSVENSKQKMVSWNNIAVSISNFCTWYLNCVVVLLGGYYTINIKYKKYFNF